MSTLLQQQCAQASCSSVHESVRQPWERYGSSDRLGCFAGMVACPLTSALLCNARTAS